MATDLASRLESLVSNASRRAGSGRGINPRESANYISFYAGFPDPGSLPVDDIIESTRVAIESDGDWALQYGSPAGDPALIEELRRKLERDQGIVAGPENILITNGGSQALALMVDMLVEPGDAIVSEAPTWMGAVANFNAAGADVLEVPIDDQGADVAKLREVLEEARATGRLPKLLYVIPNFQNPTGVTMTLERRRELLRVTGEYGLPIVEDDAYFDLRYSGETIPTLYSLDDSGRVMYMGTFSKIMAAGMRLGWVVAHEEIISRLISLKPEGSTSPFASGAATQFAASGTLVEHIHELRGLYHSRRDVMLQELEKHMPSGTTWTHPDGGFFIWVRFPESLPIEQLNAACRERGVEICPGPIFYFHGLGQNEMRLSYSFADEAQICDGVKIIGEVAKNLLSSS